MFGKLFRSEIICEYYNSQLYALRVLHCPIRCATNSMNKSTHKNNFNLLRLIFASLVIVAHVPELQDGNNNNEILTRIFGTISFGELAVDSFFVLSGFLIVKSWQDRPSIATFLLSRILRIYPGFIFASLLCALVVGPVYGLASYFQNFDLMRFGIGLARLHLAGIPEVFSNTPSPVLNGAMWSIAIEFECYLLVLACGLVGVLGRPRIWLLLFLICTAIHIANKVGVLNTRFDLHIRCVMAFMAGGCFYLYRNLVAWRSGVAWISLMLFAVFLFVRPLAELAVCIFFGYAILYYAMAGTSFLGFNNYPDISYGVYLYAWPINKIILWHFPMINVYLAIVVVFALSVFAGTVSSFLVESPFLKLKKLFR